ncbi:ankyrin repeat and LEM domain-containing protein 2 [Caerostris darwini]|uniref:Ankyrin repeat and LEM domain-containing protein 2 n=1 Tax=Caerostris darwini TaxID=1538125 RepID=A0AAV4UX88_9ARAC|nr:ankyrin repeat and LEM domain-containing protein 2 [Caerostris darwini]
MLLNFTQCNKENTEVSTMGESYKNSQRLQADGDVLDLSNLFSKLRVSDSPPQKCTDHKSSKGKSDSIKEKNFNKKKGSSLKGKSSNSDVRSNFLNDRNNSASDKRTLTCKKIISHSDRSTSTQEISTSTDDESSLSSEKYKASYKIGSFSHRRKSSSKKNDSVCQKGFATDNPAIENKETMKDSGNIVSLAAGDTGTEKKIDPAVINKGSVKYYAVALPSGVECGGEGSLIYTDVKEALKAIKMYKDARFREFTSKDDALKYTFHSIEKIEKKRNSSDDHLRFRTSQELCQFRKIIERGDEVTFAKLVWSFPKSLIGEADIPTVVQHGVRYNALHVAAKCDKPMICQLILDILENPSYSELLYPNESPSMQSVRMYRIRDLYLNTGTQKTGDTPLHYASKFGSISCCKILLSHPQCDSDKKNMDGFTPKETICSRINPAPDHLKEKIEAIFQEGMLYVPILRSNHEISPPVIGKPCSCKDIDKSASLVAESDPKLTLKAFAGPMPFKTAQQFYRALKNPSSPRNSPFTPKEQVEIRKIKFTDPERGIERIARHLAQDMKVDWTEYFPTLDVFANFTTKEGLNILENHLNRLRHDEPLYLPAVEPSEQSIALVHLYPSHENPLKHRVNVLHSFFNRIQKEEKYTTPPSSPEFVTPPSSPCDSPVFDIKHPVYIQGSTLSELDIDVYLAIQDCELRPDEYPNVYKWKIFIKSEIKCQYSMNRSLTPLPRDLTPIKPRAEMKIITRKKLF